MMRTKIRSGWIIIISVCALLLGNGMLQGYGDDFDAAETEHSMASQEDRDIQGHAAISNFPAMQFDSIQRNTGRGGREEIREKMLQEVESAWRVDRPLIGGQGTHRVIGSGDEVCKRLKSIRVPRIHFSDIPLSQVIDVLNDLVEEQSGRNLSRPYPEEDVTCAGEGINIILIDPEKRDPHVTIGLRNVSLDKVLDFILQSVGYQYDIEGNVVVVRKTESISDCLETAFFPVSRATVIRLIACESPLNDLNAAESYENRSHSSKKSQRRGDDNSKSYSDESQIQLRSFRDEGEALKSFFQKSGVRFDEIRGSDLAFEGTEIIVTHTPRNIDRVRTILHRFEETKQVEIEAKFLEVQEGALEELGIKWIADYHRNKDTITLNRNNLRSLHEAFAFQNKSQGEAHFTDSNKVEKTMPVPNEPPYIPNKVNLGEKADSILSVVGHLDHMTLNAWIRALEQKAGTDLMSAPRVTVLSGKMAEIIVAQELRYPQSYEKIGSQVSPQGKNESGSAGVTITAGTPKDFTVRKIGVEMQVTPWVESDNRIHLKLEPKVTEFEGFVEYGGTSIAVTKGATVSVPTGFFQPIFSTREIRTEVTIENGATVIMGGLTREEIKQIHDKIPVLGNIPILGKLFQSKGESTQKRNLLIFVTANLVYPSGAWHSISHHEATLDMKDPLGHSGWELDAAFSEKETALKSSRRRR